jgi:tetratricopeptide (TPR) repeat protein
MNAKPLLFSIFLLTPVILFGQDIDWFRKGFDAKEPKQQIEYFTKSIERGNDLFAAHFCRASAEFGLGNAKGAIDDYSKCIEIDPNDAASYYNRGIVKYGLSTDHQGALSDMLTAFGIDSTNAACINLINEWYIRAEDYPNAIIFYHRVLKTHPGNATIYANMGGCYLKMERYPSAMENFNTAISLQPDQVSACLGLAMLYYFMNDRVNAKKYLDMAKGLRPVLNNGVNGLETLKREGLIFTEKDVATLKKMFTELN